MLIVAVVMMEWGCTSRKKFTYRVFKALQLELLYFNCMMIQKHQKHTVNVYRVIHNWKLAGFCAVSGRTFLDAASEVYIHQTLPEETASFLGVKLFQ